MKSNMLSVAITYVSIRIISSQGPPPPGGKGPPPPISDVICAFDGSNGTYREELVNVSGTLVREIISFGCANHPTEVIAPNPIILI